MIRLITKIYITDMKDEYYDVVEMSLNTTRYGLVNKQLLAGLPPTPLRNYTIVDDKVIVKGNPDVPKKHIRCLTNKMHMTTYEKEEDLTLFSLIKYLNSDKVSLTSSQGTFLDSKLCAIPKSFDLYIRRFDGKRFQYETVFSSLNSNSNSILKFNSDNQDETMQRFIEAGYVTPEGITNLTIVPMVKYTAVEALMGSKLYNLFMFYSLINMSFFYSNVLNGAFYVKSKRADNPFISTSFEDAIINSLGSCRFLSKIISNPSDLNPNLHKCDYVTHKVIEVAGQLSEKDLDNFINYHLDIYDKIPLLLFKVKSLRYYDELSLFKPVESDFGRITFL